MSNRQITVPAQKLPPALEEIIPIERIAGKQLAAVNLKENEDFDGRDIVVTKVKSSTGEFGNFVILETWFIPQGGTLADCTINDARIVITGAENIVERSLTAALNDMLPFSGRLRLSGRSWFID